MAFTSQYTMINNTISRNRCMEIYTYAEGGGICVNDAIGSVIGENNILYGNIALNNPNFVGDVSFTYSCVEDGMTGSGNIADDPLFMDPSSGDFHLQDGSPCIDTGDPGSPLDPDSTIADMGAFYYDQSSGINDKPALTKPGDYALFPVYPNPFNSSTAISYKLQADSYMKLVVYDVGGREITRLFEGFQSAGSYQQIFNGGGLASGIYFVRLQAGNYSQTQKLLLIK